jgi:hypothetical protein
MIKRSAAASAGVVAQVQREPCLDIDMLEATPVNSSMNAGASLESSIYV